MYILLNLFS